VYMSYHWLRRYVECDAPPDELAERLTFLGLNVDALTPMLDADLDDVVLARLVEVEKIEGSSMMRCLVDAGAHGKYQVVSGAPNCREGSYVPLALPGSQLPDGRVIEDIEVAGVRSSGMLCSPHELGLDLGASDYLLEVEEGRPGKSAVQALGLDDVIFDIDLTPNYASHCQSVLGVARETAAAFECELWLPGEQLPDDALGDSIDDAVSIEIEDPDLCPRYSAALALDVSVEPSPWWIQRDLLACGIRPLNNVVDITNHVMLAYGQPLHAFDLDQVQGHEVRVRRARPGEKIITLDDQERTLTDEDLVIADRYRAIGIAGVMGAANSEITGDTERVLLESAYFDARSVLRTSRRLGLRTEASVRFEKGRDPEQTVEPCLRALQLAHDTGAGTAARGHIDVYPRPITRRRIEFRPERANALLGIDLARRQMTSYLRRLGFQVEGEDEGQDAVKVTVPSWRPDVEREVCLIEEIVRLHGYNEVPVDRPRTAVPGYRPPAAERVKDDTRRVMVGQGFFETVTYSWMSPRTMQLMGAPEEHPHARAVEVANPMREEARRLRTNLVGSLLDVAARNMQRHGADALRLFEIGKIYRSKQLPPEDLLDEEERLGILMMGRTVPRFWGETESGTVDYYHLKGVIENLMRVLHIEDWSVKPCSDYYLHPGRSAQLLAGGEVLGQFGEIDHDVRESLEVDDRICVAELDVAGMAKIAEQSPAVKPLPSHPAATRDIAFVLNEETPHAEIRDVIERAAGDLLEGVVLFDVYRGDQVPEGSKSAAYRLTYRAPERTLTDAEVDERHNRVREALQEELEAQLRS